MNEHQLCASQRKAFKAIVDCRTAALGGHVSRCNSCDHKRISYNSCRNRHCNKCQYIRQLIWVDKLQSKLPVSRYFHGVFTIPSVLHKLFYLNQRICYDLLLKAAAQTLQKVASYPTGLCAQVGAVSVLHTWGQALTYHPHVHMIIPAGGLSDDGAEWVKSSKKFFLPVRVLSKVFRGVLWGMIKENMDKNVLNLPDDLPDVGQLKAILYSKNWNVYLKKPLSGPQSVVRYLGKYTHRVAISNNRIFGARNGVVTFRWKDYRTGRQDKTLNLTADEFIGRFMRHVLPSGFYKIRYVGLLASANSKKLKRCVALIDKPVYTALLQGVSANQVIMIVTGKDNTCCPKCKKGKMLPHTILDPV